jgi:hypothetical protein
MAITPGPRSRAANVASNPLSAAVPWVASTAYPAGQVLTNAGSSYSVNAAFTTPATFSTTGLTLVAGVGATGAAAPLFVGNITGDGVATSYTVTHNLGTTSLVGQVHDPADSNAVVPGVDITFPTTTTATVILGAALANATVLTVIIH